LNREDERFWTGFLKGVLACEYEMKKAKERGQDELKEVKLLEQKVKQLHTEDILAFLNQYEGE
jgi:hypothetical protein